MYVHVYMLILWRHVLLRRNSNIQMYLLVYILWCGVSYTCTCTWSTIIVVRTQDFLNVDCIIICRWAWQWNDKPKLHKPAHRAWKCTFLLKIVCQGYIYTHVHYYTIHTTKCVIHLWTGENPMVYHSNYVLGFCFKYYIIYVNVYCTYMHV